MMNDLGRSLLSEHWHGLLAGEQKESGSMWFWLCNDRYLDQCPRHGGIKMNQKDQYLSTKY